MKAMDEAQKAELEAALQRVLDQALAELQGLAGNAGAAVVLAIGLDYGDEGPMKLVGQLSVNAAYEDPDAALACFVIEALPQMLIKRGAAELRKARQ